MLARLRGCSQYFGAVLFSVVFGFGSLLCGFGVLLPLVPTAFC